ncbi:hypothetical protein [Streptomyces sp. NPDC058412]|uniref:hypothetical protein n=1 Tax=Streptomyces sp. NPDC058412 TaxID=3346486 RepID=UPI00366949A4
MCEKCEGRRFTAEVLTDRLRGKNIGEVLDMPVPEAHAFFTTGQARAVLGRLGDVGLGHAGGEVVFEGTPARLVAEADTLTARHLREYVSG